MAASELKTEGIAITQSMNKELSGDDVAKAEEGGLSDPSHVELHRALKARHITMIGMILFPGVPQSKR